MIMCEKSILGYDKHYPKLFSTIEVHVAQLPEHLTGHENVLGCTHCNLNLLYLISVHVAQWLQHLTGHENVTGCCTHM